MSIAPDRVLAVLLAGASLASACSLPPPKATISCHQVDFGLPEVSWSPATVFEHDDAIWRVVFENRGNTLSFSLQRIVGAEIAEVSVVALAKEGQDQVHVAFSRPVSAWGGLFLAVGISPGRTAVLRLDRGGMLSTFWTDRVGPNASLAFDTAASQLVLAAGHQVYLIGPDGTATSTRMTQRVDAIANVGAEIVVADLSDNRLGVGISGGSVGRSIDVAGAIRGLCGLDRAVMVLADSRVLGRKQLEIHRLTSEQPARAEYALTGGVWKMVSSEDVGIVFNTLSGEIVVVQGLVASHLAWSPPGSLVAVAWPEREGRLVALTSVGYSILDLVGEVH